MAADLRLTADEAARLRQGFTYCPRCRAELQDREVYGQTRRVCPDCRFVQFIDPKVTAAMLALTPDNRVLMVERTMDPARGDWCLPGGFIEQGETPQQAAIRETREETGLDVTIEKLLDVMYYEDYRGSGILILYQGRITGGTPTAGDDAAAVGLFTPDELPANIAFKTNVKVLQEWRGED